jgi:CRP/FNR family transcriptional regulator, cyclic AMP receptor protein
MISDSLLQGVYLFTDLNADERASLAKIAEEMTLPAGFPIFRAGDPATALYLIRDGSVRLTGTSSGGKSIDVATLGSGSHFGEMALIDGAKRSADAATLEPTSMFRFDYAKIGALLDRSPDTAAKFYRSLSRFLSNRLRQTTTDMTYAREKNLRHF